MNAVTILKRDDAGAMAALHMAAFAAEEAWDSKAFETLLAQPSVMAMGIEADIGLRAIIAVQVAVETADILTLGVGPQHRRQGLASTLLKRAAQITGMKGVTRFLLDVAADNHGAIEFYKAEGFTQDTIRKNYYTRSGGQAVDAILMSRSVAGQIYD